MKDTIYRQDAIAIIETKEANEYGNYLEYNVAFNDGLRSAVFAIEELPSAEPNIIRCKDCKWKQGSECVRFADVRPFPDDFCSRAERRMDK